MDLDAAEDAVAVAVGRCAADAAVTLKDQLAAWVK